MKLLKWLLYNNQRNAVFYRKWRKIARVKLISRGFQYRKTGYIATIYFNNNTNNHSAANISDPTSLFNQLFHSSTIIFAIFGPKNWKPHLIFPANK